MTLDLGESVEKLQAFYRQADVLERHLANRFVAFGVDLVIADIAPTALLAAERAALPSVLVENFSWDFIYQGLAAREPSFARLAERVRRQFQRASLRCQVTPCCAPCSPGTGASPTRVLQTETVARRARRSRAETRADLGIPNHALALLVTMGGIPWHHPAMRQPDESSTKQESGPEAATVYHDDIKRQVDDDRKPWLVLPSDVPEVRRQDRRIYLPHRSRFYHPDLVSAVDGVVAKLGYSTLAEAAASGRPLAYVPRPDFPESAVLEPWAQAHLDGHRIDPEIFATDRWYPTLQPWIERLLADRTSDAGHIACPPAVSANGAHQIAGQILVALSRR